MTRIWQICQSYESGLGHGLQQDGLDLSKTPHSDPEMGEAYQIGYDEGVKKKNECTVTDSEGNHCPETPTTKLPVNGEEVLLCYRCFLNLSNGAYNKTKSNSTV